VVTRTTSFAELGVPAAIVAALEQARIRQPFPIQAETIPDLLAGKDVIGRAPTGSGKTLAFGIPLAVACQANGPARKKRPTALVLAPTRELAAQIADELAPLLRAVDRTILAVYGGVGLQPQINRLSKGIDLLVATPGRLEDLIQQRVVSLAEVQNVVVDEADRMADMGFLPAVRRILDQTDPSRQTVLYSATLDGEVAKITRSYQTNPVRHEVGEATPDLTKMEHHFWLLPRPERIRLCASVVATFGRTIVFTRTRHGADRAARQLTSAGVKAVPIHGNRSQAQRQRALDDFATGKAHALVATDVAARGIHVDAVECVVHFDPVDEDSAYLHRSGRTARAGAKGVVVSFVDPSQAKAVKAMKRRLELPQELIDPPGLEFEPDDVVVDTDTPPADRDRNRDRRPNTAHPRKARGPKPGGANSSRNRRKPTAKDSGKPGGNGTATAKRSSSGGARNESRPTKSSHKRRSAPGGKPGGKGRGGRPPGRGQGRSS
jgi:superfamily II DNA/RNA helicase